MMPSSGGSHRRPSSIACVHQAAVGAQRVELVGVREQPDEQVARRAVGRLGAGGEQQPQERADLVVGEPGALELGLREHRDHVVGGVRARRSAMIPQKYSYSACDARHGAVDVEAGADDLDGVAVEHRQVFAWKPEQASDHDDRERERQLAHEVGVAAVDERVDVLVDDVADDARAPRSPSPCG